MLEPPVIVESVPSQSPVHLCGKGRPGATLFAAVDSYFATRVLVSIDGFWIVKYHGFEGLHRLTVRQRWRDELSDEVAADFEIMASSHAD